MNTVLIISAFSLLMAALLVLIVLVYRKTQLSKLPKENLFIMLQNQIQELNRTLDQKMSDTHKAMADSQQNIHQTMQNQFSQSTKIISEVTEKLTKLDETNKQVVNFADQLQNLQETLKNPKHRGVLGEYYLETVLKNVLPPQAYQMQYKFNNGEIVDAVVFIKEKIIPIDSKFSLENYNRIIEEKDTIKIEELKKNFKADIKKRIDETSKYIRPEENTMDFAFMFIPAEGIYYDLLINRIGSNDMIEYSFKEKHVIIVSPTSFFAYLQTVMQGLRALQIEEGAKEIRKKVEKLSKHLLSYEEYLQKMGNNLSTTVNMYNKAYHEFGKIDKDVAQITEGDKTVTPLEIDGPKLDS